MSYYVIVMSTMYGAQLWPLIVGSRARIVRCGGRYDPQLVKRSSKWV